MSEFSDRVAPAASADSLRRSMPVGGNSETVPESVRGHPLVGAALGTLVSGRLSDKDREFLQRAIGCGDMHAVNDFLAGRS